VVERRFGWDCHGLPAELHSETELKLSGRREILEYGVARFNEHCRTSVMQFRKDWEYYVNRSARWVDFDNDYRTMDLSYMEIDHVGVQAALGQGPDLRGLPRGAVFVGGADAAVELRDAPRQFLPPAPGPGADRRLHARSDRGRRRPAPKLLAWTTTPWTLPSNMGLAVASRRRLRGDGEGGRALDARRSLA
jgi:isoleucyl-tRNA synthetase